MFSTKLLFIIVAVLISNTALATDYHYSGTVDIDDTTGLLSANWEIAVLNPEIQELTMLVRATLSDVQVEGPAVIKHSSELQNGFADFLATTIVLKPQEPDGEPRKFSISYSGVLLPEPMENKINAIEPGRIELNVDSFWHPIDDRFGSLLTADFVVRLGEGWEGVGLGQVSAVEGGYRIKQDTPNLDIPFSLSNSFRITEAEGYTIYDQRAEPLGIDKLLNAANQCRIYLNQHFGQNNPLPVANLLITTRPSSGYARKSYIAFTDIALTEPAPLTRFVCHEFAHYWSGAGKFDTVENWLNEAFAEYIGLLAVREFLGETAYQDSLTGFAEQIAEEDLPRIWKQGDSERGPYLVQYRKAPLLLAELEQRIGPASFIEWLQLFFANKDSSTEQLLARLQTVAGENQRIWFENRLAE